MWPSPHRSAKNLPISRTIPQYFCLEHYPINQLYYKREIYIQYTQIPTSTYIAELISDNLQQYSKDINLSIPIQTRFNPSRAKICTYNSYFINLIFPTCVQYSRICTKLYYVPVGVPQQTAEFHWLVYSKTNQIKMRIYERIYTKETQSNE